MCSVTKLGHDAVPERQGEMGVLLLHHEMPKWNILRLITRSSLPRGQASSHCDDITQKESVMERIFGLLYINISMLC